MTSAAEQIDIVDRLAALIAGLLCYERLPGLRTRNSAYVIDARRRSIAACLRRNPALADTLRDSDWLEIAWHDAVVLAAERTFAIDFRDSCPWPLTLVQQQGWLPADATVDAQRQAACVGT